MARPIVRREDYTLDAEHVGRTRRALELDKERSPMAVWMCDQLIILLLCSPDSGSEVERIVRDDFLKRWPKPNSQNGRRRV